MTVPIPAFPVCMKCDTPFILRRAHLLKDDTWIYEWIWQRDCRHKNSVSKMVDGRPPPVPVGLGTEVRVKLDFVIVVPGPGLPRVAPMDLICDGVVSAHIASEIKPGARCSMNLTPASSRAARAATKARR